MKTIKLKDFSINVAGRVIKTSTREFIQQSIDHAPEKGFSVAEMRKRFRILEALHGLPVEAVELPLEDADFAALAACVKQMSWAILDKNILEFAEQFE